MDKANNFINNFLFCLAIVTAPFTLAVVGLMLGIIVAGIAIIILVSTIGEK
jgi:hypothetical protein